MPRKVRIYLHVAIFALPCLLAGFLWWAAGPPPAVFSMVSYLAMLTHSHYRANEDVWRYLDSWGQAVRRHQAAMGVLERDTRAMQAIASGLMAAHRLAPDSQDPAHVAIRLALDELLRRSRDRALAPGQPEV